MNSATGKAPRTKGQGSPRKAIAPNSLEPTGAYAGATLSTPGTHAPALKGGNTSMPSGTKSNGVMPGSPTGGITFQGKSSPAVDFNPRTVVAEAHANQGTKTHSKTRSMSETKGFKGESTGANMPKAAGVPYNLKSSYGK